MLHNPYAHFLSEVKKPARYIGGEHFIDKKNWNAVKGKMALCFPDTYEIGMSHLGMKVLYQEINQFDDLLAERCFCPWVDMEEKIREHELPLVTLENFKPLSEFDVVGFSLQYEMSYSNILTMLELGRIPIWQKDRKETDPFVTAGGPCATHPEPLAPFVDFVVIGDGEQFVSKITRFIGEAKSAGRKRNDILKEMATWPGIYVPSLYSSKIDEMSGLEVVNKPEDEKIKYPAERYIIQSLKNYPFPTRSPIPHMTAIFDRFSVELSRGCTEGCRFCQAGMIYRPVREREPKQVIEMVVDGIKNGGFDEASLTCLSTADYSAVTPLVVDLLDKLAEDKSTLGISSLRAYGLDKRILDKLYEVKNTSLTFAPEAGSQRMRNVINKNVSEEDMLQTARDVFSRGWKKMKLYFMIGLPTETDEDVIAIMETARKAREIAVKCGVRNPTITVSVSSFVPKPHTPFQWASMITLDEIIRKQNMLADLAKKYKLNFRKHYSKISHLEGIVSRGDRRVANIIYNAWKGGARFDGWDETFQYDLWMDCVEKSGIDTDQILGTIPMKGKLPWDHIDVGLKDRFLEIEWIKATKSRLSPPCGKVAGMVIHHSDLDALEKTFDIDKKKLVCYHCGIACDLKGMVEERRDFLGSMDAVENIEYVEPEKLKRSIGEIRGHNRSEQGFAYRIHFAKIGAVSFISHLDTQKVIARIFKRAEVKLLHSMGYNQRPLISFGPALTLGVSSLSEYFDIRVPNEFENIEDVLAQLQKHSERGIIFYSLVEIDKYTKSIQHAMESFEYFYPVENVEKTEGVIDEVEKMESIEIKSYHPKKKKEMVKEIRDKIGIMSVGELAVDTSYEEILEETHPFIGKKGIFVETKVYDGSSVKPLDLKKLFVSKGLKIGEPIKTKSLMMKER